MNAVFAYNGMKNKSIRNKSFWYWLKNSETYLM